MSPRGGLAISAATDPGGRTSRVLLFHMGGVLGHLSRVLALADAIDAAGHEAILATSDGALPILRALSPGVRIVEAWDDPALKAARPALATMAEGRSADRANLHGMGDAGNRAELARNMAQMTAADRALIANIQPDAVVIDHRFTGWPAPRARIFHISPLLGLPSLHRRVTGRLSYPLDDAHILVPGIREIECWRRASPAAATFCGPFRWQGWARLRATQPAPLPAKALFFFGSTGEAGLALRLITQGWDDARWVDGGLDLETGLAFTEALVCHGGHGTVMEALRHARPVIVIPSNPEQLEIGRRIEAMRLGLLVRQSPETLTRADLAALIARVREDARIRRTSARYAVLLRRQDGAKHAAAHILNHIADLPRSEAAR